MSTPSRVSFALVSLSLCAWATPIHVDGTSLRWNFKAGDSMRYRATTVSETELSGPITRTLTNRSAMVIREDVKEVAADGSASIDFTWEALRVHSESGMSPIDFDSTRTGDALKENDPQTSAMLASIVGGTIHLKLQPNGKVTELKGVSELAEKAFGKDTSMMSPGYALRVQFSEDAVRKMAEVNQFPDKPVNTGDTWERSMDQKSPMIGTLKFAFTNKLEALEDHLGEPCAKIAITPKVSLGAGPGADSPMKMDVKVGDSDGKGVMWFSTKTGRLLEMKLDMDMNMQMSMSRPDGAAGGAMEMESNTTIASGMILLGKNDPAFLPDAPAPADKKPADGKKK